MGPWELLSGSEMERAKLKAWAERLACWSEVDAFNDAVKGCSEELGSPLTQHGMTFWRDAWLAGQHALLIQAERVRIHPEQYPDYGLAISGRELLFEATEAMRPGRRRGDEFREAAAKVARSEPAVQHDVPDEWLTPEQSFCFLKNSADKKATKNYAAECGLLIYLNAPSCASDPASIVSTFAKATATAGAAFLSVDVLWNSRLFRVWNRGSKTDLL